jgi:hypothetical protein
MCCLNVGLPSNIEVATLVVLVLVPEKSRVKHELFKVLFFVISLKIDISPLYSECGKNDFPHVVFFYFAADTKGNCLVRLVFNDVDRRKCQFYLQKMDVSSHLQL